MVEAGSIEFKLKMDAEAFKAALKDAGYELKEFGSETQRTAEKAKDAGEQTTKAAEGSGKRVAESAKGTKASVKDLAVGFSETATAAFGLYRAFDDIEKKQYALEKATLASQKADETARKAKEDYDAAVAKYGQDSEQAQEALTRLNIATDAAALADQRTEIAQGQLNEQMMMAGLTIIPSVITGIDGMVKGWRGLTSLDLKGTFGSIKDGLSSLGGKDHGLLLSAGAGIGALSFAYMAFTAKTPEMKAAFSILAGALVALAMSQWASNIAAATGLSMTGVGAVLVAAGIAAAAGMYLLSTQYGAPADQAPSPESLNAGSVAGGVSGAVSGEGGYVEPYTTYWGETVSGTGERGTYTGRWAKTLSWKPADDTEKRRVLMSGGDNEYETSWVMRYRGFVIDPNDNWQDPDTLPAGTKSWGPFSYSRGGWALSPQLALLAEEGKPERVLSPEESLDYSGGGRTIINNFYIDGARDVDLVMQEIERRMQRVLGIKY